MNNFLLGWAISSTLLSVFTIWLLYKKPSTENNIDNLKQKNKRNKQSNIDNDITPQINQDNLNMSNKKRDERKNRRLIKKQKHA